MEEYVTYDRLGLAEEEAEVGKMGGCCSRDEVGRMPTCRAMEQVDAFYAAEEDNVRVGDGGARVRLKGSSTVASMFTQQGWKGVNQDAMTVWEVTPNHNIFCGAFDGHGPYGHRVACHVRDALPSRLQSGMKAFKGGADDTGDGDGDGWFASWKATIVSAFEELDKELSNHPWIDCICSGATAVTILKQRDHLIVANLGDSRAVLCTRDDDDQLVPVQLTVDQKPNLPSESYIKRISVCDSVWDVLSNEEVINIVSSANKRSTAAKQVVDRAVRGWRTKHPTSKVDDCTVVCFFLDQLLPASNKPTRGTQSDSTVSSDLSRTSSFRTARSEVSEPEMEVGAGGSQQEWTALEGVTRVNSLLKIPRFAKALSWRKRSAKIEEEDT
ncbi:hypothetical protein GW17_00038997 [Ensete ventricosum]|nr:hypothetical protein GW17_00038997 [Ensete ventricosum]